MKKWSGGGFELLGVQATGVVDGMNFGDLRCCSSASKRPPVTSCRGGHRIVYIQQVSRQKPPLKYPKTKKPHSRGFFEYKAFERSARKKRSGQIAFAGVGEQHDDGLARHGFAPGQFEPGVQRCAGADPG